MGTGHLQPSGGLDTQPDALQVTTPTQQLAKSSNGRGGGNAPAPDPENAVAEVLENTLWNRQLGVMSEEIVAALVCQIFEGTELCYLTPRETEGWHVLTSCACRPQCTVSQESANKSLIHSSNSWDLMQDS